LQSPTLLLDTWGPGLPPPKYGLAASQRDTTR